jgi:predicted amidohydrolase YtcJ
MTMRSSAGMAAGTAVALAGLALSACAGGDAGSRNADLLFRGGVVWTGNPDEPRASAVAVRDGRIVAVGEEDAVEEWMGPSTQVVELEGRTLLPGFIDSHVHFLDGGFKLAGVDLRDAATPEEFARRIGDFARTLPPGSWITGGDWDHEMWGGELPRREWVDSLTAGHPVFVNRLDGHMALANSAALRLAGIDEGGRTPDPEGGVIERDATTGEPAGVLKDEAMALVYRVIPEASAEELDRALAAAAAHALARGVTQVHDMAGWESLETYRRAHARGALPLRVYSVVPMSTWERMRDHVAANGRGDDRLWWGGLKAFVDGSLGSTTAWFYAPYDDDPSTSGFMTSDPEELRRWILGADAAGLHVIVHAIGDAANDWLLGRLPGGRRGQRSPGSPLPHRARPAPDTRRHPPLRGAGGHRLHAALPCRRRWPLGRQADRTLAHPDHLRLPSTGKMPGPRWLSGRTGRWPPSTRSWGWMPP